jgi:hypothetical protein
LGTHALGRREETEAVSKYRKTALIEATQWFQNGDHPGDMVGTKAVDWVKLAELRPETVSSEGISIAARDVPEEAYYERLEGEVVRYFRHPDPEFAGDKIHNACSRTWHDHGWIDDLEGGHTVCPGDWIATGVQGEHWAIKPDVFAATYEPAEEARHGI